MNIAKAINVAAETMYQHDLRHSNQGTYPPFERLRPEARTAYRDCAMEILLRVDYQPQSYGDERPLTTCATEGP